MTRNYDAEVVAFFLRGCADEDMKVQPFMLRRAAELLERPHGTDCGLCTTATNDLRRASDDPTATSHCTLHETTEALRPWVEAMFDQRTVWARARNSASEISEDWFEADVTEIRRPSPYNIQWGTVCVRRTYNTRDVTRGVTYIYRPDSEDLSMEVP